jgi:hypothetical protein
MHKLRKASKKEYSVNIKCAEIYNICAEGLLEHITRNTFFVTKARDRRPVIASPCDLKEPFQAISTALGSALRGGGSMDK